MRIAANIWQIQIQSKSATIQPIMIPAHSLARPILDYVEQLNGVTDLHLVAMVEREHLRPKRQAGYHEDPDERDRHLSPIDQQQVTLHDFGKRVSGGLVHAAVAI